MPGFTLSGGGLCLGPHPSCLLGLCVVTEVGLPVHGDLLWGIHARKSRERGVWVPGNLLGLDLGMAPRVHSLCENPLSSPPSSTFYRMHVICPQEKL